MTVPAVLYDHVPVVDSQKDKQRETGGTSFFVSSIVHRISAPLEQEATKAASESPSSDYHTSKVQSKRKSSSPLPSRSPHSSIKPGDKNSKKVNTANASSPSASSDHLTSWAKTKWKYPSSSSFSPTDSPSTKASSSKSLKKAIKKEKKSIDDVVASAIKNYLGTDNKQDCEAGVSKSKEERSSPSGGETNVANSSSSGKKKRRRKKKRKSSESKDGASGRASAASSTRSRRRSRRREPGALPPPIPPPPPAPPPGPSDTSRHRDEDRDRSRLNSCRKGAASIEGRTPRPETTRASGVSPPGSDTTTTRIDGTPEETMRLCASITCWPPSVRFLVYRKPRGKNKLSLSS